MLMRCYVTMSSSATTTEDISEVITSNGKQIFG